MIKKTVTIFLLAISLLSVNSYAEAPPYSIADVALLDAMEYVKNHNVSLETAKFRLSIQREVSEFRQKLQKLDGDEFAGLYIEHEPHYRIVVMHKHEKIVTTFERRYKGCYRKRNGAVLLNLKRLKILM